MISLLFGHTSSLYVVALQVLSILFALIALGNRFIGLLRNRRRYREGR